MGVDKIKKLIKTYSEFINYDIYVLETVEKSEEVEEDDSEVDLG